MRVLKLIVWLKQRSLPIVKSFAGPSKAIGLFFVRTFVVPVYRIILFVRRHLQQIIKPTKNRVLSLVSNRFAVHVMMVGIALSVGAINVSAQQVRAEDFGQQSLLYAMVAQDDLNTLEVVSADALATTIGTSSSYIQDTILDTRLHVDSDFFTDDFATPQTGIQDDEEVEEPKDVPVRNSIETYAVEPGDNLGSIAEKFGLSLSTILWANNLTYNSTIHPGDELSILPRDGVLYTVKSGDTLSRIARSYSVDAETIMESNGLTSANMLSIGDQLILEGGEPPSPVTTTRTNTSLANLFTPAPTTSVSAGASGWAWPTDWRVITQYYGWRHTGIDVDGDYGTNSYAARGGVVIYSGWRNGYGITVEIDHGDGYMTRYAHHAKNYVQVGDVVSTGQAIAQTGTTGRSTGTHLHFEIIRNGRFQNPLDYVR